MKVGLFVDTVVFGGAESMILRLADGLRRRDVEVELLTFENRELIAKSRELGLNRREVPGYPHYRSSLKLPLFIQGFQRFLREQKLDILHSHLLPSVTTACWSARLAGIPHVGTFHDVFMFEERFHRPLLVRIAAALGTALVTVSDDMRKRYQASPILAGASMITIHNGIEPLQLSSEADSPKIRQVVRSELGLSADTMDDFVFVCVGRLVEIKRPLLLVRAFAAVVKKIPSAKLLFVGDGPLRESLQELISSLGLERQVKLLGFQKNVRDILQAADCLVQVSESEGLSCSILEAMEASLPVVATAVGGNAELITEDISGLLVKGEPDSIADALFNIAEDKNRARQMGHAGREAILTKFSEDVMVEKYLALYRKIIR